MGALRALHDFDLKELDSPSGNSTPGLTAFGTSVRKLAETMIGAELGSVEVPRPPTVQPTSKRTPSVLDHAKAVARAYTARFPYVCYLLHKMTSERFSHALEGGLQDETYFSPEQLEHLQDDRDNLMIVCQATVMACYYYAKERKGWSQLEPVSKHLNAQHHRGWTYCGKL
jgi:hypothetical protein